jgi:hypothetical protein
MLPQLAKGDANKVFVIPSEFAEAFGGIRRAFTGGSAAGSSEPAPAETSTPGRLNAPPTQ